jgi:hypothetical protein
MSVKVRTTETSRKELVMDINGAKALKKRLGPNGADEGRPASADVDIAEDAPPVYHWLGVSHPGRGTPPAGAEDDPATASASVFRRVGLSLR